MAWGALRVLRDRNAGLYLGGVVVSGFGSSAMALAAGVWAKSLTGSDSLAALTTFCVWAPALLGPLIGTLADRTRRRPLLIQVNLVMAVLLLTLLAVRSSSQLWILFTVLILYGVSAVLTDAAEAALVTVAVSSESRGDFNGLRLTANEGMKLLAPLLGAGLYVQFGGPAVAALDAVTFALAAGLFALMHVDEAIPQRHAGQGWAAQTKEGISYLWQHPTLRPLVLAGSASMLVAGLNGAAVYAVVDAGLHRSPAFAGVLYAVQGSGSVLSGLTAGALLRRVPEHVFATAGIALFAAGVAMRATSSSTVALIAGGMIGAGLPCVLIATMTAVQRETPEALVGRVAATANTVVFAPNAMALAVGAGLITFLDHRVVLTAAGTTALLTAALLFLHHRRRPLAPQPNRPRGQQEPHPTRKMERNSKNRS